MFLEERQDLFRLILRGPLTGDARDKPAHELVQARPLLAGDLTSRFCNLFVDGERHVHAYVMSGQASRAVPSGKVWKYRLLGQALREQHRDLLLTFPSSRDGLLLGRVDAREEQSTTVALHRLDERPAALVDRTPGIEQRRNVGAPIAQPGALDGDGGAS